MKKFIMVLVLAFMFGSNAYAGLNDGLLAYWSFDNCNAVDDTGTGFDGTMYGSPECHDGVHSQALFLDPINDHVKFSGALGPNNIRALSFFINSKGPNAQNRGGHVLAKYNWHGERSFRITSYWGDISGITAHFYERGDAYDRDEVSSYYEDPGSLDPTKYTIINNAPLETNVWKHVVINITDTEIEIWIDGQITNKVKRQYDQYFYSGEPVYMGNAFNIGPDFNFNYRLNGTLDEFRIYNRPLTKSEIQQLGSLSLFVSTTTVPAAKLGEIYSFGFEAVYGQPPYSWSIIDGTLPPGMELNPEGLLIGTPTEAGEFTFTVKVIDSNGDFAEKEFILNVLVTLPPPDIRINKTGSIAVPGRLLDYFIVVENIGDVIATNFEVGEFLNPRQVSLISVNPQAVADVSTLAAASSVIWFIPELAPGQIKVLSYQVKLSPEVPIGTQITGGPGCTGLELADKLEYCLETTATTAAGCAICTAECTACGGLCTGIAGCPMCIAGCLGCIPPCVDCLWIGSFTGGGGGCLQDIDGVIDCWRNFFSDCFGHKQRARGPMDPNEKLVVANKYIQPDQLLVYPIHFENIGDVEALDVFVTDVLEPNLDISTLEILTPEGASFDAATRTLRWDLIGRNLQPGETGNVLLSIRPKPGLPSGTEIRNSAEIQFEIFEPLVTPEVVNIIDTTPPSCVMDSLPAESSTPFSISWSGTDTIGEIDTYSVFVSVDGGTFKPFLLRTPDTSASFKGEIDKTYSFICIATDTAGNTEVQNPTAETFTKVISVENEPPEISISVSPDTLWPPNHKMVLITPTITVCDNCDPVPTVQLTSITVNEGDETNTYDPNYDSTTGDGHTTNDIEVDGDGNIYLRAERSGTGSGRIYTITYTATDASGNSATASATVTVPHDQQ